MTLGIILSPVEPETDFNAHGLANFSLKQGASLKDLYEIVRDSDKLLTF